MSVKGICVVLAALVCGASAVVTVTRLRGNQDSGAAVLPETSPVVVVVTTTSPRADDYGSRRVRPPMAPGTRARRGDRRTGGRHRAGGRRSAHRRRTAARRETGAPGRRAGTGGTGSEGDAGLRDPGIAGRVRRCRIHPPGQPGGCALEPSRQPGRQQQRRPQHHRSAAVGGDPCRRPATRRCPRTTKSTQRTWVRSPCWSHPNRPRCST